MALLYDGSTGMPYEVPLSEIENFLRKGFRSNPPFVAPDPIAQLTQTDLIAHPANPNSVNVNTASLKELAALPLVGTAIAKKMRDHRPYANVEDLIAQIPDVDWLIINPQLSYEIKPENTETPDAADRPE